MGASSSKIEEDKALLICCERKEFVRQAIDGRCLLAAAHLEHMQSLRNTGTALRKFIHPEVPSESSFQEGKSLSHGLDNADDIRSLREEEGFPELKEQGEKASTNERDNNCKETDIKFDKASTEHVVHMYRNRNEVLNHPSTDVPPVVPYVGSVREIEQQNGEKKMLGNGLSMTNYDYIFCDLTLNETSEVRPSMTTSSLITLSMTGKDEDFVSENKCPAKDFSENKCPAKDFSENKCPAKDFFSCVKEIDDLFRKASESGREVLRMLETNKVLFSPLFPEEIAHESKGSVSLITCFTGYRKEAQLPQAPPPNEVKYLMHRSASSPSSSSRNPLGPTSKDEGVDNNTDLFSSTCTDSSNHALTLHRLYAWERKLYDEVKASGIIRREYDMKCKLLRDQISRDEGLYKIDKTRASVKDLHSRIRVSIHRIDTVSKIIEELRDRELQPQLEESIGGLIQMWKMMYDCHKHQYEIISASYNNSNTKLSAMCSESHRQATVLLEFEINSLCSSFMKWISCHQSYLKAINGWLLKGVHLPVRHMSSRRRSLQFSPRRVCAPPVFVTCRDWLNLLDQLPTKEVADAIKDLANVTAHFLPHQEKGHETNRDGGSYSQLHGNDAVVDWSLNYNNLHTSLSVFLARLKSFADVSVRNYECLQKSIDEARAAYERHGRFPFH